MQRKSFVFPIAGAMSTTMAFGLLLQGISASFSQTQPVVYYDQRTPTRADVPTPQQKHLFLEQMQTAFTTIAQNVEPSVVNIKSTRENAPSPLMDGMPDLPIPPTPKSPNIIPPKNHKSPKAITPPDTKAPKAIAPPTSKTPPGLTPPQAPASPNEPDLTPPDSANPLERQSYATGSGVIVRSDGYILTNDHVVQGAIGGEVTVTLSDKREFKGKVYEDFRSDLAIVKIDPGNAVLPAATFASSSVVEPGQWAIAVGSPFDLENTMTVGVVSAIGRHQEIGGESAMGRYYPELIQTDAAINPGNSGGPLFNIDGKVIGINVAIESPVEGSAGVGFAIPSDAALPVMNDLIAHGKVVRGYLGVSPIDLTPSLSAEFGQSTGAFLNDVSLDSPAGKGGLRASDIVISFNNMPVTGEVTMRDAISAAAPGTRVPVEYVRDGKMEGTTVTLGPVPETSAPKVDTPPAPLAPRAKLGIAIRDLLAHDRQAGGYPANTEGVVITKLLPGGLAEAIAYASHLPLQGAVIQKIGTKPVHNTAEFEAALGPALQSGNNITMVILFNVGGDLHQKAITFEM